MSDLNIAIKIACKAHDKQTDKAGKPYILHPLRLMQKFEDEDTMIVAILHDVIEDSQFDLSFLEGEGFNENILSAVDALTKRKNENYQLFIERLSANDMAIKVKIEDLKDNLDLTRLTSIGDKELKRIKKYHQALTYLKERRRLSAGGTSKNCRCCAATRVP